MDNAHRMHLVKTHIDHIAAHRQSQISIAGSALESIGSILIDHEAGGDSNLSSRDVQGLAHTAEALGHYLVLLAEELERSANFMLEKIEEMEKTQ